MNERVMEILVYIMNEIRQKKRGLGELAVLSRDLMQRGYTESEINSAFSWLLERMRNGIDEVMDSEDSAFQQSTRYLHEVERMVISPEAFGYLLQLRELGLITHAEMETVIERAMMLGSPKVTVGDIKAMVASMLFETDGFTDGNYFLWDSDPEIQ